MKRSSFEHGATQESTAVFMYQKNEKRQNSLSCRSQSLEKLFQAFVGQKNSRSLDFFYIINTLKKHHVLSQSEK